MSKKDYIAIADALRNKLANEHAFESDEQNDAAHWRNQGLLDAAEALACVFAADNGAFNRDRWFDYLRGECGPNGGAIKKS